MEGLITDRLAYCSDCETLRPFFEGAIPTLPDSKNQRPSTDYVCATCYTIIATFEYVNSEEFKTAAQDIHDEELKASTLTPRA
jgi:hypothetical protein